MRWVLYPVLLMFFLFPSPAFAGCGKPADVIASIISKGQSPFMAMLDKHGYVFTLFLGGTGWTVTGQPNEETACILMEGESIALFKRTSI